uniref:ABC transporter ATP-binding protein n=1 Tax=Thermorudis peleae TaxID=1382356 RepID=A0A831TDA7_9BACT
MPEPVLELRDVSVDYRVGGRWRTALHRVSLSIAAGETYGLVGESGSGKSTLAAAAGGFLPLTGRVRQGQILIKGQDVTRLGRKGWQEIWARVISVVPQNPGASLNPSLRIETQLAESFAVVGVRGAAARQAMLAQLEQLRLRDPEQVLRSYPHQLSGGMQQRVAIAMALARSPALLILDEPTTGLDATVAAEALELIAQLQQRQSTAILLISHDLHTVARTCSRVGVLYAGRLVEEGPAEQMLREPGHPYTVSLLQCVPRFGVQKHDRLLLSLPGEPLSAWQVDQGCAFASRCYLAEPVCWEQEPAERWVQPGQRSRCHFAERVRERGPSLPVSLDPRGRLAVRPESAPSEPHPVLELTGVSKTFGRREQPTKAVQDVSFTIRQGETVGLIGESGSGKTTLARVVLGLVAPDDGSRLLLDGQSLPPLVRERDPEQLRSIQLVFQNPELVLNPRQRVGDIIRRAVLKLRRGSGIDPSAAVTELAQQVQLPQALLRAFPPALSGGLKQRVAIAHGLAGQPALLVLDEPTSSLDVSTQAAILNLLVELQRATGMAYLFISHDLALVYYLADRIVVLYAGQVMEIIESAQLLHAPIHPYTAALLASGLPRREPLATLRPAGETAVSPSPNGCPYANRCRFAIAGVCDRQPPPLQTLENGHLVRCHLPEAELPRAARSLEGSALWPASPEETR